MIKLALCKSQVDDRKVKFDISGCSENIMLHMGMYRYNWDVQKLIVFVHQVYTENGQLFLGSVPVSLFRANA